MTPAAGLFAVGAVLFIGPQSNEVGETFLFGSVLALGAAMIQVFGRHDDKVNLGYAQIADLDDLMNKLVEIRLSEAMLRRGVDPSPMSWVDHPSGPHRIA